MIKDLNITRRMALGLAAGAMALGLAGPAAAEVNFAGKTIEWIIPFSAGGGSDTWARFNAPLLTKYLPGNPVVVVVNEPGGGSTKGTNLFAARGKPDGLMILGTSGSTQFPYLLGDPRVRYEYKDWKIAMAGPTGGVVYTTPKLGLKGPEDIAMLKDKDLVYASQGATSLDLVPLLGFRLMDFKVQHVFGFKGRGDGRLAFERGEVNIDYQTSSAYLKNVQPLVDAGQAVPLFSWGVLNEAGDVVRDPTFPDLPSFVEAYETLTGQKPSGPDYDAYFAFFTAGFPAQKMVFLPKGTPDEIVAAYQKAFEDMKADPDYQANAEAVLGTYEQVTGQLAQALFEKGTTIAPDLRTQVANMLAADYGVKLGAE
ncbi:tricarboxylate transporter [Pannonibacter phragmitetus]|uniref:Tricarboxylate transporter n=1 Tax=Pannonibacter phragmitetus TaxID=121719 RepID=A0A0L0IRR4_9HYPH|nr:MULTISPECIES: tripartite tricarboxylate transporter substrate-binding protein [Pannonibacter]ALV26301.1 tricarboxylate transporter [Pannonibacter phragmitetus]KND16117.1 tricarboxylate transporter [Pannonibacter phragmitetus]MBA4207652.1 tricarboxylate transporter [Polymorphum sp.]